VRCRDIIIDYHYFRERKHLFRHYLLTLSSFLSFLLPDDITSRSFRHFHFVVHCHHCTFASIDFFDAERQACSRYYIFTFSLRETSRERGIIFSSSLQVSICIIIFEPTRINIITRIITIFTRRCTFLWKYAREKTFAAGNILESRQRKHLSFKNITTVYHHFANILSITQVRHLYIVIIITFYRNIDISLQDIGTTSLSPSSSSLSFLHLRLSLFHHYFITVAGIYRVLSSSFAQRWIRLSRISFHHHHFAEYRHFITRGAGHHHEHHHDVQRVVPRRDGESRADIIIIISQVREQASLIIIDYHFFFYLRESHYYCEAISFRCRGEKTLFRRAWLLSLRIIIDISREIITFRERGRWE